MICRFAAVLCGLMALLIFVAAPAQLSDARAAYGDDLTATDVFAVFVSHGLAMLFFGGLSYMLWIMPRQSPTQPSERRG